MWRGAPMYFSTYTAPLPNAASASACAWRTAAGQLGGLLDDADALAAAAGRRLDHHRQADAAGDRLGLGGVLDDALGARA